MLDKFKVYAVSFLIAYGFGVFIQTLIATRLGFFELPHLYPNNKEAALAKSSLYRTGTMSACKGGLRLRAWPFWCPFCRPYFVPWDKIQIEIKRAGSFDWCDNVTLRFDGWTSKLPGIPLPQWKELTRAAGQGTTESPPSNA